MFKSDFSIPFVSVPCCTLERSTTSDELHHLFPSCCWTTVPSCMVTFHFAVWFSGHGCIWSMVELDDLGSLFKSSGFYATIISEVLLTVNI